jgi:hypothetical protein
MGGKLPINVGAISIAKQAEGLPCKVEGGCCAALGE